MSDNLSHLSPDHRLAAARARAYNLMPYFRSGIQSLVPVEAQGLKEIAVTRGGHLLVDYEWLGELSADQAGALVLQRYLHRYFRHAERFDELLKAGVLTESDRVDWQQAASCEVNYNLVEAGCSLPQINGEDPPTPAGLGLPVNRTAEEYVQLIKKKKPKGNKNGAGESPNGWGPCGSGGGNPTPDEPDSKGPDARSDVEQDMQKKADSEAVRQASKGQDNVPEGLRRYADAQLKPSVVSWQERLSKSARAAVAAIAGSGDYTFAYRARHQGSMEVLYGDEAPVLPGEQRMLAEVALCVDTSGSMGDQQIRRIMHEAHGILQHMGGARITLVSIDSEVHAVARVKSVEEMKGNIKGGGGTDFRPAFELLAKAKPRPNVVIFATDGYGPAPERQPPGMQTIWLIIDGQQPCTWGEHIHITAKDA